jgi:hypothetical protein
MAILNSKEVMVAAVLASLSLAIPLFFRGTLQIIIPGIGYSATLASHVPVMFIYDFWSFGCCYCLRSFGSRIFWDTWSHCRFSGFNSYRLGCSHGCRSQKGDVISESTCPCGITTSRVAGGVGCFTFWCALAGRIDECCRGINLTCYRLNNFNCYF